MIRYRQCCDMKLTTRNKFILSASYISVLVHTCFNTLILVVGCAKVLGSGLISVSLQSVETYSVILLQAYL